MNKAPRGENVGREISIVRRYRESAIVIALRRGEEPGNAKSGSSANGKCFNKVDLLHQPILGN